MIPFIITIDAEGDNIWSKPKVATAENAAFIPRFQSLCESYRLKVTYLTDYTMAKSAPFCACVTDAMGRGTAEVGMHLHAWDTPPLSPLTDDDSQHLPYLIEYPDAVIRQKIAYLKHFLTDTFDTPIVSHRAGRWAFDTRYARTILNEGFQVDCSVTPHVSWRRVRGHPHGDGGTDFLGFPEDPYFLDLDDIRKRGRSSLLEVPVTIVTRRPRWLERPFYQSSQRFPVVRRATNRFFPVDWLRPDGKNRDGLIDIVREAGSRGRRHLELILHSSELMPGGSPTFPDQPAIDSLYGTLEEVFDVASRHCRGMTLKEFRGWYVSQAANAPATPGNGTPAHA